MKELSDQQRVLIAFALMLLILFVWGKFFKPPVPPPSTAQKPGQTSTATPTPGTSEAAPATTTPAIETMVPLPAGGFRPAKSSPS